MTDQMLGANVEELRELGKLAYEKSERLGDVQNTLSALVLGPIRWHGPDADAFKSRWRQVHVPILENARSLLANTSKSLIAQAAEQEKASAVDAAGAPSGGGPKSAGPAGPASAEELLEKLAGMTPQERADYLASEEFQRWAMASQENADLAKQALDQAFDDGLFAGNSGPYKDFLKNYWITNAMTEAGIDPASWDPSKGVDGNREIITKVYEYYGQLYLNDPDLRWAAMANMIGPSFAGGFYDLDMMRDVARQIEAAGQVLPSPMGDYISTLASLGDDELRYYETELLSMQKEIFEDQALMHQAYTHGGMAEIDRLQQAGVIDNDTRNAWADIASGDDARVAAGNQQLLWREQNVIITDNYQDMYHHFPTGPAVTYGMTLIGAPSIPGAHTFGEVFPVQVRMETPGPENIGFGPFSVDNPLQGTVTVTTPLPNGNIADQDARWALIQQDTLPAFNNLSDQQIRDIVSSDFNDRLNDQRPSHNIPQIVDRLLSGFDVDVDQ